MVYAGRGEEQGDRASPWKAYVGIEARIVTSALRDSWVKASGVVPQDHALDFGREDLRPRRQLYGVGKAAIEMGIIGCIDNVFGADEIGDEGQRFFVGVAGDEEILRTDDLGGL